MTPGKVHSWSKKNVARKNTDIFLKATNLNSEIRENVCLLRENEKKNYLIKIQLKAKNCYFEAIKALLIFMFLYL